MKFSALEEVGKVFAKNLDFTYLRIYRKVWDVVVFEALRIFEWNVLNGTFEVTKPILIENYNSSELIHLVLNRPFYHINISFASLFSSSSVSYWSNFWCFVNCKQIYKTHFFAVKTHIRHVQM